MSQADATPTLASLYKEFQKVREKSLSIASPLSIEDMQIQSMPDASPIKWHLAHTSWAFETFLLKPYLTKFTAYNEQFEYLFNSYYNAVGKQFPRSQRGLLSRPSFEDILEYRAYIDRHMEQLLSTNSVQLIPLVKLMLNHEQQHQELMMTDIKHALYQNPDFPAYNQSNIPKYSAAEIEWFSYESGIYPIGHQNETFYFDNEGPQHRVFIEPFKIANRLITCREYIEFIERGGYQEPSYWLSEAWYKIQEQKTIAPLYWVKQSGQWYHFTLSGLVSIDLDSPVTHINYFEANAYAASVNKRLPTEQEWEVAAKSNKQTAPLASKSRYHPTSGQGAGIQQMFGELWQWTSSSYSAYPGFKTPEGAIGEYNGKFMVNQYVLKGGSFVTPEDHIRPSYRNFFYPDASWQFTGIRLAESQ